MKKRPYIFGKIIFVVCVVGLLVSLGVSWVQIQKLSRTLSVEQEAKQKLQAALVSEEYKTQNDEGTALKRHSKKSEKSSTDLSIELGKAKTNNNQVEALTHKIHELEEKVLALTLSHKRATERLSEAERDRGKIQRSRSTLREQLRAVKGIALENGIAVPAQSIAACGVCPRNLVSLPSGAHSKDKFVMSFDIGRYEVTQREWQAVMGENPSPIKGASLPVTHVSWSDVQSYLTKLNEIVGLNSQDNNRYRLPTSTEWEYAAYAGQKTPYFWGNDMGDNNANCASCGSKWDRVQPAPVGSFKANHFGLFDMSGNVYEWVDNCKHPKMHNLPGYSTRSAQVCVRSAQGGSFLSPDVMPTSIQFIDNENQRVLDIGFRIAKFRTIH